MRFFQNIAWDGAWPLVVALGPILVRLVTPRPPLAVGMFLFFCPLVAMCVRARMGWHQIANRCGGRAPWLRQIAMAFAIVVLFGFEGAVSILTFSPDIPALAWLVPLGFYAGYLSLIAFALRPASQKSRCAPDGSAPGEIAFSE